MALEQLVYRFAVVEEVGDAALFGVREAIAAARPVRLPRWP
jgi:hypothetical protein